MRNSFFFFSFFVFDPSERPEVLFKGVWETKIFKWEPEKLIGNPKNFIVAKLRLIVAVLKQLQ